MAAALTLVPALCRLAGRKVLPRKVRRTHVSASVEVPTPTPVPSLTARWAAKVGRTPLPWAIGAALVMILLALPVLDMRTWPQDPSTQSVRPDHPQGLRPGRRRVRSPASTARSCSSSTATR